MRADSWGFMFTSVSDFICQYCSFLFPPFVCVYIKLISITVIRGPFCGFFWPKDSSEKWIVVAFKGTSPNELQRVHDRCHHCTPERERLFRERGAASRLLHIPCPRLTQRSQSVWYVLLILYCQAHEPIMGPLVASYTSFPEKTREVNEEKR
jgi:hypothetical protein